MEKSMSVILLIFIIKMVRLDMSKWCAGETRWQETLLFFIQMITSLFHRKTIMISEGKQQDRFSATL